MSSKIKPRKVAGWEFFNENIHMCDIVRPGGLQALQAEDRKVAEWFITTLRNCHRVIDLGCGSGFPGLYVAPYVDELVGVDAAPNMVCAAQANASISNVKNVLFKVGGADGLLPFEDGEFDGALLCGVLESMDWESVHQILSEVQRVLTFGGRLAVVDQDWQDVLKRSPKNTASIRFERENLTVQVVKRSVSPNTEKCTWYRVDPHSHLGQRLLTELGSKKSVNITIDTDDLERDSVLDAWYDEIAQFDAETLTELIASKGFHNIIVDSLPVWQKILVLTAIR